MRYIMVPVCVLVGTFVLNALTESLIERYECRKWYNFFNMSVHCHLLKRISYMCDTGLEDWLFNLRKYEFSELLPVFEKLVAF